MVEEARLEQNESGLAPADEGWFVVNVRDAAWLTHDTFGADCMFESPDAEFPEFGIRLVALLPGQPNGLYHREETQEDFLVLSGECLLLVEGEERRLRAWDFFHCPWNTEHILVGAGERPCVILMAGTRRPGRPILLSRLGACAPAPSRRRDRDSEPEGRVRLVSGRAGRTARVLGPIALGLVPEVAAVGEHHRGARG